MHSARVAHAHGVSSAHLHSTRVAHDHTRARPSSASAGAAHAAHGAAQLGRPAQRVVRRERTTAAQRAVVARHACPTAATSPAHGRWRGKRGGAHRRVDGGAARRRRRRRRVTWRAWMSASATRQLDGDRRRPTGTREKISVDRGARDAMARPHSPAHRQCRRRRRRLRTRRR
jgi:hypothetical protein